MQLSPERCRVEEADVVCLTEGSTPRTALAMVRVAPPGSKSRACLHWGSPGTWEGLSSPLEDGRAGDRRDRTPGRRSRAQRSEGSEPLSRRVVP